MEAPCDAAPRAAWIGVDLDATLAHYTEWKDDGSVGAPISVMVGRVKVWLAEGREVRIMTARVSHDNPAENNKQWLIIEAWCREHIGTVLPITCKKDMMMIELWDDRAVQVIPNTGMRADGN